MHLEVEKRPLRILGTGVYLPPTCWTDQQMEEQLGLPAGWVMQYCGVRTRHRANGEQASSMAAKAALQALAAAEIGPQEIDLVIGACGTQQQTIPSMGALIHKQLGLKRTVAFDVNSTCLSFLTALDLASYLLETKVYRTILIVSADVASAGLNPADPKTATLFGDGAAAAVVQHAGDTSSGILASSFETWSEAQEACVLAGGGSYLGLPQEPVEDRSRWLFQMDGPKLLRQAFPRCLILLQKLMEETGLTWGDLSALVCHQASPKALEVLARKLQISTCRLIKVVDKVGNMVAASLPYALHTAISAGDLQRGERCMLLGTSAGISVGGMVLEY